MGGESGSHRKNLHPSVSIEVCFVLVKSNQRARVPKIYYGATAADKVICVQARGPNVNTIFRRFLHTFQLSAMENNIAVTRLLQINFEQQGNGKEFNVMMCERWSSLIHSTSSWNRGTGYHTGNVYKLQALHSLFTYSDQWLHAYALSSRRRLTSSSKVIHLPRPLKPLFLSLLLFWPLPRARLLQKCAEGFTDAQRVLYRRDVVEANWMCIQPMQWVSMGSRWTSQ